MNTRHHVNNMGVKHLSDLDIKAAQMLRERLEHKLPNTSDKELLKIYNNSLELAGIYLHISFLELAKSIKGGFRQCGK